MQGSIKGVDIKGIVSAVPKNRVDNLKILEGSTNKRAIKQMKLTGIRERRITLGDQSASDLASVAGEDLMKRLRWKPEEIRVIVYVTQSEDLQRPSSAFLIQKRLGIGNNCMVFDINQGCAGYVIGLSVVGSILSGCGGKGLLFVGESAAAVGGEDNHSALMEGDAAAATALEYTGSEKTLLYECYGDGRRANMIFGRNDGKSFMDGNGVLLFGLGDVARSVKSFLGQDEIGNVDYYVFHQAQKMIVDGVVQESGVPADKVLMCCEEFGNTSSASIPLTICTRLKETESKELRVFMCGFGIGLTWASIIADINRDVVYPLIETDFVYDDMGVFEI